METSLAEVKRDAKEATLVKEEEDGEDEDDKYMKRALTLTTIRASSAGGSVQPCCQVQDCTVDMAGARPYHRRHKVCEFHSKAPAVLVAGLQQRFCQQCSRMKKQNRLHLYGYRIPSRRFHEVSEFDEVKRSCRGRLAMHNERRRKILNDSL
ncbi:squamosa promoter-binding protein 1-like isoform X1 [Olea europaea var. sylvestris]|uniref:Squamosa promoter-binding 1-like n=1 Tax=Olea europaea subsp. europaea TaxID=158383 RepID=A0A8S0RVA8_OLEEU|nr:squamosa promoter-binding protein 1-like isoform X1 [Olea europaea var. sylvestris]CAA2983941.1 squamosa promoter-binding 1-like [Olea europaea subsp. europaea]